jgi:multiple antibiotic resistance protein
MTSSLTPEERGRMVKAVALNSFLLLLASALIGAYVLDFFGLSIPSVQVAGGIVVCGIAWSQLNSPNSPPPLSRDGPTTLTLDDFSQRAFYPLTMPLTVGPGSITVAMTLGANPTQGLRPLIVTALAHALGILIVAASVYLCYRYAGRILKKTGPDRNRRRGPAVRIYPAVHRRADLLERCPCTPDHRVPGHRAVIGEKCARKLILSLMASSLLSGHW